MIPSALFTAASFDSPVSLRLFAPHLRGFPHAEKRTLRPAYLLLKHLLNLPDFPLDLTGELFGLAFSLQVGVRRDLPCFLFDLPFQLMKLAFDLILRARFHASSSVASGPHHHPLKGLRSPDLTYSLSIFKATVYNGFETANSRPQAIE
jgi:hypothetical protein